MEEIKFRYILKNGEKIFIEYYTIEEIEDEHTKSSQMFSDIIARNIYTGWKDKNEKEIYTGDIVSYLSHNKEECFGIVKFIDGKFVVIDYKNMRVLEIANSSVYKEFKNTNGDTFFSDNSNYKIIGNKYENLDLFKKIS